jgi:hypothetical protein
MRRRMRRAERYDETFNPQTGLGGFEIWIPVKK